MAQLSPRPITRGLPRAKTMVAAIAVYLMAAPLQGAQAGMRYGSEIAQNANLSQASPPSTADLISQCESDIAQGGYTSPTTANVDDPQVQLRIAYCLEDKAQFGAERVVLLRAASAIQAADDKGQLVEFYWYLALAEDHLKMHAAAVLHITLARRIQQDNPGVGLGDVVEKDYRRINVTGYHAEIKKTAQSNRRSWDMQSADERQVLRRYGGTPENGLGYPCHVEEFNARNYHQETWWYGCGAGGYTGAYTFRNGQLQSTYFP